MQTQDFLRPAPARNRMGLWRLSEGVSQPPWATSAAALAVLLSGFFCLCSPVVGVIPLLCSLNYLARQAGTTIGIAFGLRGAPVGKAVVSGILLCILELLLMVTTAAVLEGLGFAGIDETRNREEAGEIVSSLFLLMKVTVLVPFVEELAYRGLLYTSLRTRLGVIPSAVVTAAVFGLSHQLDSFVHWAMLFVPAVLSSLWYERTRSLWPNLIEHALNNFVATVGQA